LLALDSAKHELCLMASGGHGRGWEGGGGRGGKRSWQSGGWSARRSEGERIGGSGGGRQQAHRNWAHYGAQIHEPAAAAGGQKKRPHIALISRYASGSSTGGVTEAAGGGAWGAAESYKIHKMEMFQMLTRKLPPRMLRSFTIDYDLQDIVIRDRRDGEDLSHFHSMLRVVSTKIKAAFCQIHAEQKYGYRRTVPPKRACCFETDDARGLRVRAKHRKRNEKEREQREAAGAAGEGVGNDAAVAPVAAAAPPPPPPPPPPPRAAAAALVRQREELAEWEWQEREDAAARQREEDAKRAERWSRARQWERETEERKKKERRAAASVSERESDSDREHDRSRSRSRRSESVNWTRSGVQILSGETGRKVTEPKKDKHKKKGKKKAPATVTSAEAAVATETVMIGDTIMRTVTFRAPSPPPLVAAMAAEVGETVMETMTTTSAAAAAPYEQEDDIRSYTPPLVAAAALQENVVQEGTAVETGDAAAASSSGGLHWNMTSNWIDGMEDDDGSSEWKNLEDELRDGQKKNKKKKKKQSTVKFSWETLQQQDEEEEIHDVRPTNLPSVQQQLTQQFTEQLLINSFEHRGKTATTKSLHQLTDAREFVLTDSFKTFMRQSPLQFGLRTQDVEGKKPGECCMVTRKAPPPAQLCTPTIRRREHLITDERICRELLQELKREKQFVGVDIERSTYICTAGTVSMARLVQLYNALLDSVSLVLVPKNEETRFLQQSGLAEFFEDPEIIKFVVSRHDLDNLELSHGIVGRGFVDVSRVAAAIVRDAIGSAMVTAVPYSATLLSITCKVGKPPAASCIKLANDYKLDVNQMWDQLFRSFRGREKMINAMLDYAAFDAYAAYWIAVQLYKVHPSAASLSAFDVKRFLRFTPAALSPPGNASSSSSSSSNVSGSSRSGGSKSHCSGGGGRRRW
jgi:3'-5' exonuclease